VSSAQPEAVPQVAAVQPEQVERKEAEGPAAPHQLVEQRPFIRPGKDDLAVQDGGTAGEILTIVAINPAGAQYAITPLFVSVTGAMILTDHDGRVPDGENAP
jgi:hypothetical protein